MTRIAAIFILAGLLFVPVAADEGAVVLRSGTLGPAGTIDSLAGALRLEDEDVAVGGPVVVRFREPLDPDVRASATAAGLRLAAPVQADAYLAWIGPGALERARGLTGVEWIVPFHPGLRIAPEVAAVAPQDPRDVVPVTVHLFAHADAKAVASRLEALGVKVTAIAAGRREQGGERSGRIVITPCPELLAAVRETIARWPETQWIGLRPAYRLLNDGAAWLGQSGRVAGATTPISDRGLLGEGQVVGVLDTGIDADMCFFRDPVTGLPPTNVGFGVGTPSATHRKVRIVDFLWGTESPSNPAHWDTQGHGTHVAGTVAGDNLAHTGARDPFDGMAPQAKLVIQDGGYFVDNCADLPAIGCPAADLIPFFDQAYLQGARIHSNSWGDRENLTPINLYSDGSQDADAFMWSHPDFLLVFAAGNSGSGGGTVLSPATAKNVLAVGATNHDYLSTTLASFSSRGPAGDGRIKPDVTAPGVSVLSAGNDFNVGTNNCSFLSLSGTSMACPTAAGLAALVREYYEKGYYPGGSAQPADAIAPSAALLKATMMVSGTAMEGLAAQPPSNEQGWGRVLLDDALFFPGDSKRLFAADVASRFASPADPPDAFSLQVTDASEPLRVILTWTDYPSTPAASVNLVNDLDLTVESPTGTIYKGNVFSAGVSQPLGVTDRRNNVEGVRIAAPAAGAWTVRVAPFSVPQPSQGYALVATGRILAGAPLLERVALSLDDAVGGDGDGLLEPGEWVDAPVTVTNRGTALATGVSVGVESLSPFVEVVAPSAPLPDLAPGAQAATAAPHLRIRVTTSLPCSTGIRLRLTYASSQGSRSEEMDLPTGGRTILVKDDFETATTWAHVAGESTTTLGAWVVGDPVGTGFQPEDDASPGAGTRCLYTAANAAGAQGTDEVDAGVVVARSGSYDLTGHPEARLSVTRWYANRDVGADAGNFFRLHVRETPASPDVLLEEMDSTGSAARWTTVTFRVADLVTPGATVQLRIAASDGTGRPDLVEAALDEVVFWDPACDVHDPPPGEVMPLRADRVGDDVLLFWDRPALDPAHGEADQYRVHRSEDPSGGFVVAATVVDSSASVTWSDPGAALAPAALVVYLVAAEN